MGSTIANGGRGINLYTDPWCPVVRISTGEGMDASFADALLNASDYVLSTPTRLEQVAILRNLCALAGTILYRYDASGKEAFVKDIKEAVSRWKNAYENGFSKMAVEAYGEKWKDHLFLHDEKLPFYQTPNLNKGKAVPVNKDKLYCISKINPVVFESKNKPTQFASVRDENKSTMTEAELARGLMFIQAFNDNAAKENGKLLGMSWPGHRTTVYAEGRSLLETILFNIPMFDRMMELWDDMTPEWERDDRPTAPTFSSAVPRNPAKILTAQSRRIELFKDEAHKYGSNLYEYGQSHGGDIYDHIREKVPGKKETKITKFIESPMNDPMIVCNNDCEDPSSAPTINGKMNGGNMWLISVNSFLKTQDKAVKDAGDNHNEANDNRKKSYKIKSKIEAGIFDWLQFLEDEGIVTDEARLQFTSLSYKQQAIFEKMTTASSVIRLGINNDEEWRSFLTEETANVNAIALILNNFERRMRLATGNDGEPWAQKTFMDYCRKPFERLVYYAKPGTNSEALKKAWNRNLLSLTEDILIKLLNKLNVDGAVIREAEDGDGKSKQKKKILCTPGEISYVRKDIRKLLSA